MNEIKDLAIPRSASLVTADVIDSWEEWYRAMAERTVEDAVFANDGERQYEVCRRMLDLCAAGTAVNDAVRQRTLAQVSRYRLYHHAPEGWPDLGSMLRGAVDGLSSSGISEWTTVLETVVPFADKHSLEIYEDPIKAGYLREASSGLKAIITGPGREREKARQIKEELRYIFQEAASRREVRDRYREYQGVPGQGLVGDPGNGSVALLVVASPSTAAAIRQKVGRLVQGWQPCETRTSEQTEASKIEGQRIQRDTLIVEHTTIKVFDANTGELLQEV